MIDELIQRATTRVDSWVNMITNVGAGLGKTAFDFVRNPRLTDATLEELYHGDPFAAKIVKLVPEEALRRGIRLNLGDAKMNSAVMARMDELRVVPKAQECWTWARNFGGAVLFVGADDGVDPALPLDLSNIRTIRFLTVLDKRELWPSSWYNDPLSPNFGEPKQYRISRYGAGGSDVDAHEVHASRVIRWDGPLTNRRRRAQNNGWNESELQRIVDVLQQFNGVFAASATLIQDASQGVYKLKNLYEMIVADKTNMLKKRMELLDMSRSVGRGIMMDAETEDFIRRETSLAGLPDCIDKFLLLLSGASEIPVTLLMGRSPAGLNATGESDTRAFYDRLESAQQLVARPRLERLTRLIMLAQDGPTRGLEPSGQWSVQFPSLWQPTPQEEATIRKLVCDADVAYIGAGVLTAEEVSLSRFKPEGWNMDTQVDVGVRQAMQAADRAVASGALPSALPTRKMPAGVAPGASLPSGTSSSAATGVTPAGTPPTPNQLP